MLLNLNKMGIYRYSIWKQKWSEGILSGASICKQILLKNTRIFELLGYLTGMGEILHGVFWKKIYNVFFFLTSVL